MGISLCVYCGSNPGNNPAIRGSAVALGTEMGRRGHRLIYGGSHLGMMGAIADAVLAEGGDVTGIVPQLLVEKEAAYKELKDLRVVESMHERKALMADLADGFIALPGGFGTLDELFEIVTWTQLRISTKPVVVWNVGGFYDKLFAFLDGVVGAGLLKPQHRALLREAASLDAVFEALRQPVDSGGGKWTERDIR